jgi:hypothetical protein
LKLTGKLLRVVIEILFTAFLVITAAVDLPLGYYAIDLLPN